MSKVRIHVTVSADGYVAGPNPSEKNPLGDGGGSLHDWAFALRAFRSHTVWKAVRRTRALPSSREALANVGAEIMGRGKFGGGPGPWGDRPWPGWCGDDPAFHMPVFVLTHHERAPLALSEHDVHLRYRRDQTGCGAGKDGSRR